MRGHISVTVYREGEQQTYKLAALYPGERFPGPRREAAWFRGCNDRAHDWQLRGGVRRSNPYTQRAMRDAWDHGYWSAQQQEKGQ